MEKLVSKDNLKNILKSITNNITTKIFGLDKRVESMNLYNNVSDAPIGTVIDFLGTTPPDTYVICDGSEYSVTGKMSLFAAYLYTQYGSINYFGGDGETTFAVPNLPSNNPDVIRCIRVFPLTQKAPIDLSTFNYYVYVDYENGSDEFDGLSPEYAKKTIKNAVSICPSTLSCIIMMKGTHKLIASNNSLGGGHSNFGLTDEDKPIVFIGFGKDTILEYDGNGTCRDRNMVGLAHKDSLLANCHYKLTGHPGGSNYQRAVLGFGWDHCENVYFDNVCGTTVSASYDNNNWQGIVRNCTFRYVSLTGDYSGNKQYINCVFDNNPSRGTKTNCVIKTFTAQDLFQETLSDDIIAKGFLEDGATITNLGVAGGKYPWSSG